MGSFFGTPSMYTHRCEPRGNTDILNLQPSPNSTQFPQRKILSGSERELSPRLSGRTPAPPNQPNNQLARAHQLAINGLRNSGRPGSRRFYSRTRGPRGLIQHSAILRKDGRYQKESNHQPLICRNSSSYIKCWL